MAPGDTAVVVVDLGVYINLVVCDTRELEFSPGKIVYPPRHEVSKGSKYMYFPETTEYLDKNSIVPMNTNSVCNILSGSSLASGQVFQRQIPIST